MCIRDRYHRVVRLINKNSLPYMVRSYSPLCYTVRLNIAVDSPTLCPTSQCVPDTGFHQVLNIGVYYWKWLYRKLFKQKFYPFCPVTIIIIIFKYKSEINRQFKILYYWDNINITSITGQCHIVLSIWVEYVSLGRLQLYLEYTWEDFKIAISLSSVHLSNWVTKHV